MIGEWPGLAKRLDALSDMRATSDCRGLCCALPEQWLGHDAGAVISSSQKRARPRLVY